MKIKSVIALLFLTLAITAAAFSQTTKTHVDRKNGFSFGYPSNYKVTVGKRAASETAFGDPGKGRKLLNISPSNIPSWFAGFYEFNIWVSTDPAVKCGEPTSDGDDEVSLGPPDEGKAKTRKFGSHTFYAYSGEDGGMSKSLGLKGYRGMIGKSCYQIQSLTYRVSANDTERTIKRVEAYYPTIDKAFARFIKTFRFLY